jgi:hypothetical protein
MKIQIRAVLATLVLLSTLSLQPSTVFAQGTAFTYQGRLNVSTNPANGSYDLRFTLFPVNSGGAPAAGPLTNSATGVSNGLFMVTLDFGGVFTGTNYWLEIGVRTNGSTADYILLNPLQLLTPTPYETRCRHRRRGPHPSMDLDLDVPGLDTVVTRYMNYPPGGAVELWTINGATHFPILSPEFAPRVIDWLLAHPKP